MRRPASLFLSLVAAVLAGCAQHAATLAEPKEPKPGEIGSRLPEFSVKDLQGHEISSSELRGKVVLVDFRSEERRVGKEFTFRLLRYSLKCTWRCAICGLLGSQTCVVGCVL